MDRYIVTERYVQDKDIINSHDIERYLFHKILNDELIVVDVTNNRPMCFKVKNKNDLYSDDEYYGRIFKNKQKAQDYQNKLNALENRKKKYCKFATAFNIKPDINFEIFEYINSKPPFKHIKLSNNVKKELLKTNEWFSKYEHFTCWNSETSSAWESNCVRLILEGITYENTLIKVRPYLFMFDENRVKLKNASKYIKNINLSELIEGKKEE